MAVFSRIKTWVSNEVLTASDLNGEFNNILNNMDTDGIEDYSASVTEMRLNTDPGGVGTESLATTLSGELERIRFAIKRIVGGAQWYSAPVIDLGSTISASDLASDAVTTAKILDLNVTTAKINDLAVTTGKLADGSVTATKLSALGHQRSSSSGTFSMTGTSPTAVTNLSCSLTTTGNPVEISLIHDETSNLGYIGLEETGITEVSEIIVEIFEGSNAISKQRLRIDGFDLNGEINTYPLSMIRHIHAPSASTYTYTVKVYGTTASAIIYVYYAKLFAYELR